MKKKRFGAWLCTIILATMLSGCSASTKTGNDPVNTPDDTSDQPDTATDSKADDTQANDTASGGKKIAISMPTQSVQRWIDDSENMRKELEAKGYEVEIQFAGDNPQQQAAQIQSFVEQKVDCMIVVPIDSKELTDVAEDAKNADIPVISYDRLLMDTDAVYYYASFDNKGVGTLIGKTIAQKAGLDDLSDGEYKTIEFFMGCPDDNNSHRIYEGLMEVMQPYLDDGRLVCKSGRTSFEDTCISRWSQETAKDTEQYHNHVLTVPAYLCNPDVVDQDNLKEVLIDSGYYTQEQIEQAE